MIRFIQVIFSAKQKFNKQAKAAITNKNLSNSRKMRGKPTIIYIYKKMCKTTLIYIRERERERGGSTRPVICKISFTALRR